MNLPRKKRVLYLNGDSRQSPWAEMGTVPPDVLVSEGWALSEAHLWQTSAENEPIQLVLIDIDVIARTQPLDEWALKAWRSTFNDLIARATHPDGKSPLLLGYTREPTWENATVAMKIGTRDATRLSKLNEKIRECLDIVETSVAPENVVTMPDRFQIPTPQSVSTNDLQSIPKHAIPFPIDGLEGTSSAIESVRNLVRKTAPLDTSVMIVGPTGSGKERVARAIHRYSSRASGPFVAVNCGAIAPGIIESELFGHAKGAYTGAHEERVGYLASANGGTLFLDEVSELPPEFQVKLLRTLQERQITPVGSSKSIPIDIRILSATKQDLEEAIGLGRFREDLLYRLRVIEIVLPSLKERRADIPALAKTILAKLSKRAKRPLLTLSENAIEKFLLYTWPGNIRELENTIEHAATLTWSDNKKMIEMKSLPESVQFATMATSKDQQLKEAVKLFEKEYIASTVRRLGSKEQAADALGLSLATLYRKLGS